MEDQLNDEITACEPDVVKNADICVPIELIPFAGIAPDQTVSVTCAGDPVVTSEGSCGEGFYEKCTFKVIQNVDVSVPMRFTAHAKVGDPSIACSQHAT